MNNREAAEGIYKRAVKVAAKKSGRGFVSGSLALSNALETEITAALDAARRDEKLFVMRSVAGVSDQVIIDTTAYGEGVKAERERWAEAAREVKAAWNNCPPYALAKGYLNLFDGKCGVLAWERLVEAVDKLAVLVEVKE